MQISAGEAGPPPLGAGKGGAGEVLAAEVLLVLVGEGVVDAAELGPGRSPGCGEQQQAEHQAQQAALNQASGRGRGGWQGRLHGVG